eukprot:10907711-Alexandrium_andersonii.AAC.1
MVSMRAPELACDALSNFAARMFETSAAEIMTFATPLVDSQREAVLPDWARGRAFIHTVPTWVEAW